METAFLVVGVIIALAALTLAVKAKSFSRLKLSLTAKGLDVDGAAASPEPTPIESLITTVSTLAEEVHGLKERVYHLEMEKAVNQQTIRHLNEKVEYLQVQLTRATTERDVLLVEIAELRTHITRLENKGNN
jgi:chromosome segregation ATPase